MKIDINDKVMFIDVPDDCYIDINRIYTVKEISSFYKFKLITLKEIDNCEFNQDVFKSVTRKLKLDRVL